MKYDKDLLMQKLVAHEGMRLDVYKDTLGINTIGIGRNLDDRGITKDELDWMDYPSIEYVYSDGITEADVKGLKEEILEATQMYMARNAPKAAMAMTGALYDPTELGIRDKMSAAKELLDRTGLIKTEKVQVEAAGGVMLMPAKAPISDDD